MKTRKLMRQKRKRRIRAAVAGTATRPRAAIFRSGKAIFVQLIDDSTGNTLVAKRIAGKNIAAATTLGKEIAKLAKARKISEIVFDRGGFRYHGAIKALAEEAREGGLKL